MAYPNMVEFEYLTNVYNFLNAIADDQWTCYTYYDSTTGKKDALGHYGCREGVITPDGMQLAFTFKKYNLNISDINDGFNTNYAQATPKLRVLNAIDAIRALLYPEFFE